MTEKTKACNLTEDEVKSLIILHGDALNSENDLDDDIERINYLNKRLKTFKEPDTEAQSNADIPAADAPKAGW